MTNLEKNNQQTVTAVDLSTGTLPKVAPAEAFRFEKLIGGCGGGGCPTVYRQPGDPENFYIQGYNLTSEQMRSLVVPDGEGLVRIPKSLIQELLQRNNL